MLAKKKRVPTPGGNGTAVVDIPLTERLSDAQMGSAKEALKAEYISFGLTAAKFEQAQKEKAKQALATSGTASGTSQAHGQPAAAASALGGFSAFLNSDEEDGEGDEADGMDLDQDDEEQLRKRLGAAFDSFFPNWRKVAAATNWKEVFASELSAEQMAKPELCPMQDLFTLDMSGFYKGLEKRPDLYGHLPRMARCWIGGNMAVRTLAFSVLRCNPFIAQGAPPNCCWQESFCERMISVANDILTDGNTLLNHVHLKKLVLLRVNRKFM